MSINKTTEGLIKAAMQIAGRNQVRAGKYPRYAYRDAGIGIHARRALSPIESARLELAKLRLRLAKPGSEERKAIFAEIQAMPTKAVPVRYAELQDHGRYTGERLRSIRSIGGGAKEQARAARRAAAMRGDGGTVFANDNEGIGYGAPALAA